MKSSINAGSRAMGEDASEDGRGVGAGARMEKNKKYIFDNMKTLKTERILGKNK